MNADQKETSGAGTEKAFRQFDRSAEKRKENRNWQKKNHDDRHLLIGNEKCRRRGNYCAEVRRNNAQ